MSDPIRDALAAELEKIRKEGDSAVSSGAEDMLRAYDEAKLAHGDTTLETTKRVRRPGGKKK